MQFLAESPLLYVALCLGLGSYIGHFKFKSFGLGPAAVLFSAIIGTSLAVSQGVTFEIPEVVGTLGLVLFTYTIGVISGPTFFASLRSGWRTMLAVVGVFVVTGVVAVGVGGALGLRLPVIAGTFAGALTNMLMRFWLAAKME